MMVKGIQSVATVNMGREFGWADENRRGTVTGAGRAVNRNGA